MIERKDLKFPNRCMLLIIQALVSNTALASKGFFASSFINVLPIHEIKNRCRKDPQKFQTPSPATYPIEKDRIALTRNEVHSIYPKDHGNKFSMGVRRWITIFKSTGNLNTVFQFSFSQPGNERLHQYHLVRQHYLGTKIRPKTWIVFFPKKMLTNLQYLPDGTLYWASTF